MIRLILIFFFNLFALYAVSQTTIGVVGSDYKNEQILFYTYSDYITFLKDTVALVNTDEKGGFSTRIELQETKEIFTDLGVFRCSFYAEKAKKNYILNLPPKREKTEAEKLNIYFEPIEVRIEIKDESPKDLNRLIASFDNIYNDFLTRNFDTIYRYSAYKLIDKFEEDMNNYYSEIQHLFFTSYRNYKIYELRFLGPNRSYETITFKYYNRKKIRYNNFSYMHLFNLMYKDFFNYYSNTKEGEKLQNIIKEGRSVKQLKALLEQNNALSDNDLEELIILKGINDEFFNPKMPNQTLFPTIQLNMILDSIANYSNIEDHRKIANNIIKKTQQNNERNNPEVPNFELLSIDNSIKKMSDFKGKFVYLNFMRTDVVPAMESMDRLINFYKEHKSDIEIVSVFTDDDILDFQKLDTNKYQWPLLYLGNNKEILEYYRVITWPQFYLISPEGKLVLSPAPSLKENFEIRFFEIIDK